MYLAIQHMRIDNTYCTMYICMCVYERVLGYRSAVLALLTEMSPPARTASKQGHTLEI